jgi:hypothetical protein
MINGVLFPEELALLLLGYAEERPTEATIFT